MLAPLDNETIFKKAFTNKIVFEQFVKDIFGVDINVNKIETEKKYSPKSGYIDLSIDIYAETTDNRFIIEIQRIDYDHNFERFLYYFLQTIAEQQKSSKDYSIKQEVLAVVVLTQPYIVNKKTGQAIQDNVLKLDFDVKNLKGEIIKIWGHNLVFLNSNPKYKSDDTPSQYEDWLALIRQSVQEKEKYTINLNNKGIAKAVEIIDYKKTTSAERRLIKITEGRRIMKIKERALLNNAKKELVLKNNEIKQNQITIKQKESTIKQKENIIEQNESTIKQNENIIEQNEEILKLREKKLKENKQALLDSAKIMKNFGASIEQIVATTKLSKQDIENL